MEQRFVSDRTSTELMMIKKNAADPYQHFRILPRNAIFLAQARKRGLNLVSCKDLKELAFKPVGAIVQ